MQRGCRRWHALRMHKWRRCHRAGTRARPPHIPNATLPHTIWSSPRTKLARLDHLGREIAHQHSLIEFRKPLDRVVQPIRPNELRATLLLTRIANTAYHTQQVEPHNRLLRIQLHPRPRKQLRITRQRTRNRRTQPQQLLQRIEEVLKRIGTHIRIREAADERGAKRAREQELLHSRRLFLQPNEDCIERRDLPILIRQQGDVKLQPLILPQNLPTYFPAMRHIAQNRQRKLLQRPLRLDNLLQKWDDAVQRGVFLARLGQAAQVVHNVEDLVGDFAEAGGGDARTEEVRESFDCSAVLQRVVGCSEHGKILDEFEHRDLVAGGHAAEVFEDA